MQGLFERTSLLSSGSQAKGGRGEPTLLVGRAVVDGGREGGMRAMW